MTPSYDELDKKVKALGDYRLLQCESGRCLMVSLSDPSVGIWERELSPTFDKLEQFAAWLNEMQDIFSSEDRCCKCGKRIEGSDDGDGLCRSCWKSEDLRNEAIMDELAEERELAE